MAETTMALADYPRQVGAEPKFLREEIRVLAKLVMELETEDQIGAGLYERSAERMTHRNGYRERTWTTRVDDIPSAIPKLRQASYFPSFLEPRRPAERALLSVVQQAYIQGVTTSKVDDLLAAMGVGISDKSRVSQACKELDELVLALPDRPLESGYP